MLRLKLIAGMIAMLTTVTTLHAQQWKDKVKDELPLMGHRNWIVIVDSAYPLQSGAGVETIETGQDQLAVLDYVLDAIKSSSHVRPIVHTDAELQYIPEKEAPGVEQYRRELTTKLSGFPSDSVLHQTLIDRVNELGKSFHVLVLKSNMTIPYTSIFLQLDCKYWGADAEARLRAAMKAAAQHPASNPAH